MTNPIQVAVAPLKDKAQDYAEKKAAEFYGAVVRRVSDAQWDLYKVAPRPRHNMSRVDYKMAAARYQIYSSFFDFDEKTTEAANVAAGLSRWYRDAFRFVTIKPEARERFIKEERANAGFSFDKYVAKLIKKVGDVDEAAIDSGAVWHGSTLTVRKGDKVEQWYTQQIINVSVLGKVFNQWPTRKLK